MITPTQLYEATEEGLSILELHIPSIREAIRKKTPFKLRDEKTASAHARRQKRNDGSFVYCVTDFGDDGKMKPHPDSP